MTYLYPFNKAINLHVKDRISSEDAQRQEQTARELLRRLSSQPGVILADEVGMGKTFVALAVATSIALNDPQKRSVVVMVPSSLKQKWPTDFELFRQKCLPSDIADKMSCKQVDGAVAFLKLIDNANHNRPSVIFLTHTAFSRQLIDSWVMLAFIRQSLHRRRNSDDYRKILPHVLPQLLNLKWVDKPDAPIWQELLETKLDSWLKVLKRHGIDPENDKDKTTDDDPVPEAIAQFLSTLTATDTQGIFDALNEIPRKNSKNWNQRVKKAAQTITAQIRLLWPKFIQQLDIHLPLLILDEAHHLKNKNTRLATLFQNTEMQDDVKQVAQGALGSVFEKMLLLTATPFQLGHQELCSVLSTFNGVNWHAAHYANDGQSKFETQMTELSSKLDKAQQAAVTLDVTWGRLQTEDLIVSDEVFTDADQWWSQALNSNELTDRAHNVMRYYQLTRERMKAAEESLRPWVVRHLRPRYLPDNFEAIPRREQFIGNAICDSDCISGAGITLTKNSLLPFLLAARATSCAPENRPVFAEGLASSYEAFLHTRRVNSGKPSSCVDSDSDEDNDVYHHACDETMNWYLNQLEELVPKKYTTASTAHPKIAATVEKAVALWRAGEKVLIFCHYIATGQTLRLRISEAIDQAINNLGAEKMGCTPKEAGSRLEQFGKRFFDDDSPVRRGCDNEAEILIKQWPALREHHDDLQEVMRRFMRTPSFLTRFFSLDENKLNENSVRTALDTKDTSGITLGNLFKDFLKFLAVRCGEDERVKYVDAVNRVQTGSHVGKDNLTDDNIGLLDDHSIRQLPNVRLVNGSTNQETRARYMLAFNTPFYPEILVTSNVLAEGVDLHLSCRHIIHHDLCWNPSTLEQRTGRIDRIGAKAEKCGHPINIYLPYIAETQDEKMYRVVMDRERWFSVVMGENYKVDAQTTEKLAKRIPFPEVAASELAFNLSVYDCKKRSN